MPQAVITINASPGSDADLPINTLVQLNNQNSGGELTYLWSIEDQPVGPADALSNVAIQNPTFTPTKEGTYLIKLIVNSALPTEQMDTVIAAVLQFKSGQRVPAAGETTEASTTDGWALAVNSFLQKLDGLLGDDGMLVASNQSGGALAAGTVVRFSSVVTIKAGLPGEETVPGCQVALATTPSHLTGTLGVVVSDIAGASPVGSGQLMKVRVTGKFSGVTGGPVAAVGDSVYVSDTGTISVTPGTNSKVIGAALNVAATYSIVVAQVQAAAPLALSLAAVGATPNANAATLTGTVLNLEPASVSFPGAVTTLTQSFTGAKTFILGGADVLTVQSTDGTGTYAGLRVVNDAGGAGHPFIRMIMGGVEMGAFNAYSSAAFGMVNGVTVTATAGRGIGFRVGTTSIGAFTSAGDFYVDTNTLYVDAVNNRVGIGTSTPTVPLDVVGAGKISGALELTGVGTFASANVYSMATGITAFAGGGQLNATALTKESNFVTTVASAADSVKLPVAVAGMRITVFNLGANSMDIYPVVGSDIDALGTNNPFALAAGLSAEFIAQSATQWRSR